MGRYGSRRNGVKGSAAAEKEIPAAKRAAERRSDPSPAAQNAAARIGKRKNPKTGLVIGSGDVV